MVTAGDRLRIVEARHTVALQVVRVHVSPAPEMVRRSLHPIHPGLALVVVKAAFPLLSHLALTVITDHGERAQR